MTAAYRGRMRLHEIGGQGDPAAMRGLPRVCGALLVTSLLILMFAFVVVVSAGALPALSASLSGSLEALAPHAQTFQVVNFLYAIGWIVLLLGFVGLTVLLVRAGDLAVAALALAATGVATVLAVLEATFHVGMTTWAAGEAAATGNEPVLYTPVRRWVSAGKLLYMGLGLSAQVGYGGALLKTAVLPRWVGKTTVIWSLTWLVLLVVGIGAPATVFIAPAVIGAVLLNGKGVIRGEIHT